MPSEISQQTQDLISTESDAPVVGDPVTESSSLTTADTSLARKAADILKRPSQTPEEIVDDLLARLQNVRRRRELSGLNHWTEFAPTYLQKLLARHEALRRRAIEAFFCAEKSKAIGRAKSKLGNRSDAEDAVAEAFLKLFSGKADPKHFNRILRFICVDKLRARMNANKLFDQELDAVAEEKMTGSPDWRGLPNDNPLEALLCEEAIQEAIVVVKARWENRNIRRLGWWKDLTSRHAARANGGKRLAQTNI